MEEDEIIYSGTEEQAADFRDPRDYDFRYCECGKSLGCCACNIEPQD